MSVLDITDLTFGYTDVKLLNKASLRVIEGDHMGLVGLNGCGKSTLMNIIAHRLSPDSGDVIWDKNKTFSYLDQMLVVSDNITITE